MSTTDLDTRLRNAFAKHRPKQVSRVITRRGTDSTGDPAVWIWVILRDGSLLSDDRRTEIEAIRSWAEKAAGSVMDEWAYVAFRTEEEQQEVEAEGR